MQYSMWVHESISSICHIYLANWLYFLDNNCRVFGKSSRPNNVVYDHQEWNTVD